MAAGRWSVLPHGTIEKLSENLWWVEGSLPRMSLKRAMTVARRRDGKLVVHSAIALDEACMAQIDAFGEVAFLVVPSPYHRLDAPAYKRRYPNVRVFVPRGARDQVAEKVAVDGCYEDYPRDDETVQLCGLQGVKEREGAVLVRSSDGLTVVLNDVMFNLPRKPSDVIGWLMLSVMGSAPGPRVSRLAKAALVANSAALRGEFERLAELPDLQRLIVAHGEIAKGPSAASALRAATAYLV